MTSFSRIKDLIELCCRRKIKLVGIDFRNFGFNEELQKKIKNQQKISAEEEKEIDKIISDRENRHLKFLEEYKNKSTKPIIVILGSWHLRKKSPIFEELDNYKLIFPCDEKGNLVFEPKDNISWCEK